jgi:hydrogenase maturation protease
MIASGESGTEPGALPLGRTLVAGVGNWFLGDDAFGCEVVRALSRASLPSDVTLADFGTRSFDLVQEVARGYADVILLDAHASGLEPGALRVFEPSVSTSAASEYAPSGHELRPHDLLSALRAQGASLPRLRVVGCEPESFGDPGLGRVGLSSRVEAAVPRAVAVVARLLMGATASEASGGSAW